MKRIMATHNKNMQMLIDIVKNLMKLNTLTIINQYKECDCNYCYVNTSKKVAYENYELLKYSIDKDYFAMMNLYWTKCGYNKRYNLFIK